MKRHDSDETPFSYPVKVGHISANPVDVHLEADDRELAGLAALWDVLSVGKLAADLKISRWKGDGVRIKGNVKARIVQACVVTLEPVESDIDEDFEHIFVPEDSKLARAPSVDEKWCLIPMARIFPRLLPAIRSTPVRSWRSSQPSP